MPQERIVKAGDTSQRVGVEVIRARGVDVEKLIQMLIANAAAEFASTYYYYTILRMHLAVTKITKRSVRMRAWKIARISS